MVPDTRLILASIITGDATKTLLAGPPAAGNGRGLFVKSDDGKERINYVQGGTQKGSYYTYLSKFTKLRDIVVIGGIKDN